MKKNRTAIALIVINLMVLVLMLAENGSASDQSILPVLRGRAMELIDLNGKTRERINMESTGDVVLRLFDERGTIRVKIGASKSESGLVLLNDSTEVGVHLLAKDNGSSLRVMDKNGRQRLITP